MPRLDVVLPLTDSALVSIFCWFSVSVFIFVFVAGFSSVPALVLPSVHPSQAVVSLVGATHFQCLNVLLRCHCCVFITIIVPCPNTHAVNCPFSASVKPLS